MNKYVQMVYRKLMLVGLLAGYAMVSTACTMQSSLLYSYESAYARDALASVPGRPHDPVFDWIAQ